MTRVAITQDDDISAAISGALRHFDLRSLVQGKRVAIKPNETWASAEDLTPVTQGDSLRAVIRQIKLLQPREIIVSGGAGDAETEDVFRLTGMMDAIESEGVAFFDHNRPPFIEVPLQRGPERSVMINPRIQEYEVLIVLSQLKVHSSATVTLALKNIAMSFPAADFYGHPRHSSHGRHFFEDLHGFIASMAAAFPISFAITVGHPAMVATGPIGGFTAETGLVIASDDALAADVVGAKILGFNLEGVRHLKEAAQMDLGEHELDNMEFPALSLDDAIAVFTERVYGRRLSFS